MIFSFLLSYIKSGVISCIYSLRRLLELILHVWSADLESTIYVWKCSRYAILDIPQEEAEDHEDQTISNFISNLCTCLLYTSDAADE